LLAIPAQESPDEEAQTKQQAYDRRGFESAIVGNAQESIESNSIARFWEVNDPGVVQWNTGEDFVGAQRHALELFPRDLRTH